MQCRSN